MLNALCARIMTWAAAAREEAGQGMVEYALILVLVSIAAIVTLGLVGAQVDVVFTDILDALTP
jgi:pilus assembly protein Flp/PilA